jgi:hypothetical protein
MEIQCYKCKKVMTFAEFIAYPAAALFRALEKPLAEFFVRAVESYLSTPKKGVLDDCMAGAANICFKIECPICKSIGSWVPAPEKIQLPEEKQNKQLTM